MYNTIITFGHHLNNKLTKNIIDLMALVFQKSKGCLSGQTAKWRSFSNKVIEHVLFQGGSTSGEVSRTAYILISLLEARIVEGVSSLSDCDRI